ncbi:hypothetical protein FH972_025160 [Carpinus fangiana]|uniref:SPRY domain-containing protein n=1 Tax=Carpinus fangiana TaxID=176857 RepID=A0A5N6L0S2_9ROSI|nr:hypothetical protein FH972_025160 [Carpinus fangiana]
MNFTSCCFKAEYKSYHFDNFTFVRPPDHQSIRTASFHTARSRLPLRLRRNLAHQDLHRESKSSAMLEKFNPPPGPPPGYARQGQQSYGDHVVAQESSGHASEFAPPPGPPPSHQQNAYQDTYEPPQGPPPSKSAKASETEPPPYHDWTVIPDTALLPPPPSFAYQPAVSPVANASRADGDRAWDWTNANPLWPPRQLSESEQKGLSIGFASIIVPQELKGEVHPNKQKPGLWHISTTRSCNDASILSSIPMYSALYGSPAVTRRPAYAYFEVKLGELGQDSGVALGFLAPPYPTWRLPGWQRASLAVHGDDGRRFVNDTWGGKDFVPAFEPGDTVGLGMYLRSSGAQLPSYSRLPNSGAVSDVEVFFTRNGKKEASWDLHEETDAKMDQPGGVTGLEGDRDLYAAIGVYGPCEFEIKFGRHNWLFKPEA